MNATICCSKCGNDGISMPGNSTDECIVTCPSCGAELGLWGDLISAALDSARENFERNSNQALWNVLCEADELKCKE